MCKLLTLEEKTSLTIKLGLKSFQCANWHLKFHANHFFYNLIIPFLLCQSCWISNLNFCPFYSIFTMQSSVRQSAATFFNILIHSICVKTRKNNNWGDQFLPKSSSIMSSMMRNLYKVEKKFEGFCSIIWTSVRDWKTTWFLLFF